jgi:hypothetical protein
MTVTATKIDSSNESGKNVLTWEWPASTTIIYNNPTKLTTSNNTFFNLEQCCEITNGKNVLKRKSLSDLLLQSI